MTMSTRTTQQYALYAAEDAAPRGREFTSHAEVAQWVADLIDSPWWADRFPCVRNIYVPDVKRNNGDGSVGAYFADDLTGQIEMHRSHWCEKYLCHEIAHVTAAPHGSKSHDPLFASHYCELVYRTMGTEAWLDLRGRFVAAGIVIAATDG